MYRKSLYDQICKRDRWLWAHKDKALYEADRWYTLNRVKIASKMLKDFSKSLLDVGCGDGDFLAGATQFSLKVGFDISLDRLKYAQKVCPEASFVAGDAYKLPFRDHSFEVVSSQELLEHLEDTTTFLSELHRVSSLIVFLSTPNASFLPPDGIEHVKGFKPKEILDLLNESFKVLDKRGNIPGIFNILLRNPASLPVFQEKGENWDEKPDSFENCTQMFLLLEKK